MERTAGGHTSTVGTTLVEGHRVRAAAGRVLGASALLFLALVGIGAGATPATAAGQSVATAVSSGYAHTCALTTARTVECWGTNTYGQLGDGSTTPSDVPVTVHTLSDATAVAAGNYQTCALMTAGTVECWGWNADGQLGDGSTTESDVPALVETLTGVTAVAAGGTHTCALTTAGTVECWGWNGDGELGNGSTTSSHVPVHVTGLTGVTVTAIVAGGDQTCALTTGRTVECWGTNTYGQLGNGLTANSEVPVTVTGLTDASAIAAGGTHTCALTTAGTVECWGANVDGQLGNGLTANSDVPVLVHTLTGATAIAAGGTHTCALTTAGTVECWGDNYYGELGDGSTADSYVPVPVTGLTGATAVAAGYYQTCALAGAIECWGYNVYGQLGTGSTASSHVPVAVRTLTDATAVSAGYHQTCALLEGGTVECWGTDADGQLGDGSTASSPVPVPVHTLTAVAAVAAGGDQTCALVTGGTVECWGTNTYGQLGDDSTANSDVPVTVTGLTDATAIAAGGTHTCALTTAGTVECWGYNAYGQLGDDSTAISYVPVPVHTLTGVTVTAIAAGAYQSCALVTGGTVECWGANAAGQLGDGSNTPSLVPVPVHTLTDAAAIAAGNLQTCALTTGGTVECWGDDATGQLGNGSTGNSDVPVAVHTLTGDTVTAIAAGGTHTCALTTAGTVECWGRNTTGQLGDGSTTESHVPVTVETLTGVTVTAVTAGYSQTCALTTARTVECWGTDDDGQLGNGSAEQLDVPVSVVTFTAPSPPPLPGALTPPTPPAGALSHASCSVGAGAICHATNDSVTVTASFGPGALTISQYSSDPESAPTFTSTGEYFDVEIASGSAFGTVTVKDCNLSGGTRLYFWDPATAVWEAVTPVTGPAGTPPCLTATLGSTSSPMVAEPDGTVFAVGTPPAPATRVYGTTADATAAAELTRTFPDTKGVCPPSRAVVVATTAEYDDALSSQFLAQSLTTGTLLTPTQSLATVTATTLEAEGITKVYVVGGPLAITATVVSAIEALTADACGGKTPSGKITVTRIAGETQYGTAEAIATHVGTAASLAFPDAYGTTNTAGGTGDFNDTAGAGSAAPSGSVPTAILASGIEFQDAQSASVVSYHTKLPLLLTPPTTLSTTAVAAIEKLGVKQVILMGGTLAVTNTVETALAKMGVAVLRVGGVDYTDTAAELARFEVAAKTTGLGWTPGHRVMVARGNGFTDGIAGAVLDSPLNTATGATGTVRPLLLTETPKVVGTYLTAFLETTGAKGIDATAAKTVTSFTVLGGPLALTTAVVSQMETDLGS